MNVLMLDNYDSFTYNIVQYLGELGADVTVVRNDEMPLADLVALVAAQGIERIVISPGPCSPAEAGIAVATIQHFAGQLPVLGVCLGHQAIGAAFGGDIVRAGQVHQIAFGLDLEEHQLLGAAGCLGDPGQAVAVGQRVEGAGLAGIGPAGEGHLRAAIGRQLPGGVRRKQVLGGIERVRHPARIARAGRIRG